MINYKQKYGNNSAEKFFGVGIKTVLCGCAILAFMNGCGAQSFNDIAGIMFNEQKTTVKVVKRQQISLQDFLNLTRNNRQPDILFYSGSANGFDYFVSSHCITTGGKPNQRIIFENSIYWLPSDQVGFRHHLPLLSGDDENVYYDLFAQVDIFKSALENGNLHNIPSGIHRLPEDAISKTVDGTYRVFQTLNGTKLVFFTTNASGNGKRGLVYSDKYADVNDLLRDGLVKANPNESGIVLAESLDGLGRIAVFDTVPYNSKRCFFAG